MMLYVGGDTGMKAPCRRRARIIARGRIDVNRIFGQGLLPDSVDQTVMCGERSSYQGLEIGTDVDA